MKNTTKSNTSSSSTKNYNLKIKGQGQLINNDCLAGMKNLPDNSIDLVLTDPPYGIANKNLRTWVGASKNGGKAVSTEQAWGNDFQDNFGDVDGFWEWFKPFMSEMTRVTKDGGSIILFLDTKYQGLFVYRIEKEFGLKFRNSIYFTKNNPGPGLNLKGYRHACEQAIWFTKGKTPYNFNFLEQKDMKNVFSGSIGTSKETKHPCEKYKWMIEPLIERHSNEGQLILDPFGGSASTLVYGIKKNRKVIAFEKNETFFQMAKERVEKHNLDVLFFEPNKKIEDKKEIDIEVNTVDFNSKIKELDDSAKKQVHDLIQSLLSKSDEFIDEPEPLEQVKETVPTASDGILEEMLNIKTNIDNDYMSEKTRSKIKSSIIELTYSLKDKGYNDELRELVCLDFKQRLYCDIKTKLDFFNIVRKIKDKMNDCANLELEEVS
ncbi:site-specific DNA-methyltransferase [Burkholderia contaminans]|uniref:DNA-methyltransferase n=2 Tax=Pseudomonadota TaxID=1224 RepID=UPI000A825EAB|nr:site-specific DNA-methyltransferase [Burkholderia contaminans]MDN8026735.1 site-specific DNA-methyltransferase [Burkholderia contaminans]